MQKHTRTHTQEVELDAQGKPSMSLMKKIGTLASLNVGGNDEKMLDELAVWSVPTHAHLDYHK